MVMTRHKVVQVIQKNGRKLRVYGVRRLGLFGSVSRGRGRASSDLDFLVELEKKTFDAYMGLKLFLEDLFGCRVDLVLSDSIKPMLREAILKDVIYVPGL